MDYLEEDKSNCFRNLTFDEAYSSLALSSLCAISLIISIPAVTLGIHEYCVKSNLSDLRTERLLLYLASGSCIASFLGCFQWISHYSLESQLAKVGCSILSYLWLMVAIFIFVITLCIGVHFLVQLCRPKLLNVPRDKILKTSKRMEVAYVSLATLLAIILSPWPFFKNLFGYNLWICWLRTINNDCQNIAVGSMMVTVFYVAFVGILIFSFCVILMVQILICLRKRNVPYLYVWAFMSYLGISIAIFFVTMIVSFLNPKSVPSALHGIKIFALGMIPLTASLVALIAVSYKKWFDKRSSRPRAVTYKGYSSIDGGQDTYKRTQLNEHSRAPTTDWTPPPTDGIPSSTMEDT